ncbi:rho GTPase-activating protein 190-like isoform X18 [Cherax quadricarinatus]|uniref:rho GTPase-activating protein 190-like isoform X18 n=1 Tax=Cherax quadricarinatus TaxID=27406 RepID=UPI00387E2626
MARRGGDAAKQVVVSVVGVSGGEREKGVTGLGKSCLCNRFTKPQADQYYVDHISVLSQTDFSGRVVNNDHFLYWGEAVRLADDGLEFSFQVIEQTEFIDDASFMPFKAGKMDPYIKRCCATKIQSAEKLMYICKNQLGIEKEYEQRVLPDGKLNVDGFLCVFDVSQVPNRSLERQVELTASILNNCLKTKRPVVLVTTKNDEANEVYVKEAEKLASRKEFKGNIPLVETSSHENVNVDCAFMTLVHLIDRNRGRIRIVPFYEAARHRKEILDVATDAFQRLVRTHVLDYRSIWATTSKKLAQSPDFIHYVDLFGMDQAAKLFRRHVKKLKDEYLQRKVEAYMDMLPSILREFFPDLQSLEDGDWLSIQQRISEHPDFDRYFLRCNEDIPWSENTELLDSADTRIPFDVLDSNEAETVFKNHVNALQAELEMREMRDKFKLLLAETGYVTPGKRLDEVRVLFMGRESFDSLSEHDRQFIYDQHQKDITEKARQNFHELLLEQAELFYHVKSIAPTGTITQEDIREITQTLQEDSRYKALDRLESERTLLLLQHLGFVHCPKKEHCPSFPNCMDCLIEKIIANKAASNSRPGSGTWSSKNIDYGVRSDPQVNLILLGNQGLAEDLQNVIRSVCEDDEFELDNQIFSLDYRSIDGDVSLPQNSFKTPEFTPHGVVCAYSNEASLEYVRESLEKSLLTQLEREESTPTPPITVLFAPDPDLDHNTSQHLHDEGANLADSPPGSLQCTFMDVGPSVGSGEGHRFDSSLVTKALRSLITSIHHRNNSQNIFNSAVLPRDSQPDIRIIMCMLCGDPYSVENVLSPLLSHQWCVVTGEQSISLQTFLDDCKRRVEVIVSSYHGANAFREDLVHGFILVYSTKRKASLATLRAFSANIPNLPIQILAMTDTNSASAFFGSDISQQLITEGNAIADRLQAHFMTSTATCQQKTAFYTPFFKEVWDKKPEIEQAFNMEDPSGLDDSGEGTLERPPHHYHRTITLPPPRRTLPPRSQSAEGSSSEIYETVPTDGSQGDDLDEPLSPVFPDDQPLTPSDDSDIYSHIDNDEEEHLVKPSQLKKQHRFQQGWQDDSLCSRRLEDYWGEGYGPQAFTTGRRAKFPPPPTKPRPKGSQTLKTLQTLSDVVYQVTTKQPGKLNLKAYSNVTDAIGKINLKDAGLLHSKLTKVGSVHAPLATPENMDLGPDYAAVKDAVPVLYGSFEAGDYGYSRVQEIPQAAGSKARRQRREKGRQAYSDSDSEWSSLERRRTAESYKVNRKAVPKRMKKKRLPIPVAAPRVPPLPSFYVAEGGPGTRYSDERLLLDPYEKVVSGSASDDSEATDREDPAASHSKYKPQKRSVQFKKKTGGREGVAVRPPVVPPLPPTHPPPHPPTSHPRMGLAATPHHNPLSYPMAAQLPPDTDLFSPSFAPGKLEGDHMYRVIPEDDSSLEVSSPRDQQSPILPPGAPARKDTDKTARRKQEKIRSREEARQREEERKRAKDEEKLKKAAEKEKEREKKKAAKGSTKSSSKGPPQPTLEDFVQSPERAVPLFLEKCVYFIEVEGLDSEGIYRVPGNKVHVEQLTTKFKEDNAVNFAELDIPVNAAATALKDYLKQLPPLLPQNQLMELTTIASIGDRSLRLLRLKEMLTALPRVNFEVLKFIFQHFVRVAENCKLNSMDSKNLAICWWPTLLHTLQFTDIAEFESQRPHIEDIIQTMIDQFPFLFQGKEDYVMV